MSTPGPRGRGDRGSPGGASPAHRPLARCAARPRTVQRGGGAGPGHARIARRTASMFSTATTPVITPAAINIALPHVGIRRGESAGMTRAPMPSAGNMQLSVRRMGMNVRRTPVRAKRAAGAGVVVGAATAGEAGRATGAAGRWRAAERSVSGADSSITHVRFMRWVRNNRAKVPALSDICGRAWRGGVFPSCPRLRPDYIGRNARAKRAIRSPASRCRGVLP